MTVTESEKSLPETARAWILKKKVLGKLDPAEHLELKTVPLFPAGTQKEGKFLVRITHIQVDPTNLIWISESPAVAIDRLYLPPVNIGQPVMAGTVGEIVASWHPDYKAGEIVYGYWSWADYVLIDPELLEKYRNPTTRVPPGISGTDFITLALTSITAYAGLTRIAQATKENCKTLVVTAAAGSVGSAVIQIARNLLGIEYIVGIAGSEEKCKFLKDVLKVDVALNYKKPDFRDEFIKATPNFIDLYWDNVAGPNLALAISRIAFKGKVVACGTMTAYDSESDPLALPNSSYLTLAYQQASILGVIFTAFYDEIPALAAEVVGLAMQGKLIPFSYEVKSKLEDVPKGFDYLFKGENIGKVVLRLPDI